MLEVEKAFIQVKKVLGGNEYNSLVPSQLSIAEALRILSNGSPDFETFIDQFICSPPPLRSASIAAIPE